MVGGSGRNLIRLVQGFDGATSDASGETEVIDADALALAVTLVRAHRAADLVARTGLRDRRIRQMAAGTALIEATMREYGLDELEVSDASLREGAILAVALAGDRWREHLASLGRRSAATNT